MGFTCDLSIRLIIEEINSLGREILAEKTFKEKRWRDRKRIANIASIFCDRHGLTYAYRNEGREDLVELTYFVAHITAANMKETVEPFKKEVLSVIETGIQAQPNVT